MQATGLKGFNLSIQQARLWSLQGESQAYRTQCAVRLEGTLDIPVFLDIFHCLVNRHTILRTAFYCVPGMEVPLQMVANRAEVDCAVIGLEDLPESSQAALLHGCFAILQSEAFDLTQSPLIRARLFCLSMNTHILFISLPALCADDATLMQCIAELGQAYTVALHGEHLAEEPLQYADIAAWQDELLREEDAEQQCQYWQRIDLSQLAAMRLPLEGKGSLEDRESENGHRKVFCPGVLDVPMEKALSSQIQAVADRYGVSLEAYLLTCWQVVLRRLIDEPDFVIGVACNGRIDEELKSALGLYTRFVPIETLLADDLPFEQALVLTNASLEMAFEEQVYFTWKLAGAKTENNTAPLFFPMCFDYNCWPASFEAGERLTLSLCQRYSCTEPFVLKLSTLRVGESLRLELHYDSSRVMAEQVERLSLVLRALLQSAVAGPQTTIVRLPILPASEQKHLLHMFCAPATPLPAQILHQLFEEQAKRRPCQLAVVSDGEQLTYQELNSQANQLARVLRQRGVGPNVLVGLCVSRSAHMLVSLLAILKAGGAYVPLDVESPPARVAYQLQDIQAPLLITQQGLLPRLPGWAGQTLYLETISEEVVQESPTDLVALNGLQDLAYVIYTSGSTGMPKGVMIRQQSVVNYTLAMCELLGAEPGWHYATVSTLAADLGNTAIFCALAFGGCLQVLGYNTITSREAFARWVTQSPIDVLKIVPSHLSALLMSEQARMLLPRRALVLGGEALPTVLVQRLRDLDGTCAVYNHYGPTETTIGVLVNELGVLTSKEGRERQEEEWGGTVALGRPIANTEAYVLDRGQQIVPVGVVGELYLGGMGVALGYLHQAEQTAERFVPHPFDEQPGARLYRTGDLARYSHQEKIEFVGRHDSQVKLRGYRIELGEIEAVLRRHANIWDAVAVLREDIPGEPRLVGYMVVRNPPAPTAEALREFTGEYLPQYMLPSMFVSLEALPLTTNGKVDRQQLPRPELSQNDELFVVAAPRSPIEEILLEIWTDLLAVTSIGIYDNFFIMGGHSLLAMQLISRVRAVLQVEIPVRSLFESPTIAELAQLVEQALRGGQSVERPPLVPVPRTQDIPLSFAQRGIWFLDQLEPGSSAYLIPRVRRLRGVLDVAALEKCLGELVRRHESLRTTFQMRAGQPVQVIHPVEVFRLPLVDLCGLGQEECAREARSLADQEKRHPCDLAQGPLLRTFLLRLDTQEHRLLVTMHHIISDAWSNDVFYRELTALYRACATGEPPSLPPLPIQYADYVLWQHQWLQGQVLEAELAYWRQQLAGVSPLELPADHPRPLMQTLRGASRSIRLPGGLRQGLTALSQQEDVTLFMLLLAAFKVLLGSYTGQSDISVGTPIANRTHAELEGLIGIFVNTLVLRTDLAGNPTFCEILKRVREVCVGAYAHQYLPFELLVEALRPARHQDHSPLFQVMFMLQNPPGAFPHLDALALSPTGLEGGTAKFDLTLSVMETAKELIVNIEYNVDLFDKNTIERMLYDYKKMLEKAVENPDSQLQLSTLEEEQTRLIGYFNEDLEDY